MEGKYLKTAFILIFVSIFLISAIFVTVLISVNKVSFLKPPTTTVTCTQDQASSLAEQFVKNTTTYTYDGIAGSVKRMSVTPAENGSVWQLSYYFKSKQPGYGDRSGQVLAEQVTEHSVQITIRACRIVSAVMDKNLDLLSNKPIK
jgi:hypothetical protein